MIASTSLLDDLLTKGAFFVEGLSKKYLNPASLDIPLTGGRVWYIPKVFTNINNSTIEKYASYRGELHEVVLESEKLYLIEGPEIQMPENFIGLVDAKSTTGRLGIKADLITEVASKEGVNLIPAGYSGKIWFMVAPHIPIILSRDDAIMQVRLRRIGTGVMASDELKKAYGKRLWLEDRGEIPFSSAMHGNSTIVRTSVSRIALMKKDVSVPIVYGATEKHDPVEYWKFFVNKSKSFELRQGELYLMGTSESYFTGDDVCWKLHPLSDLFSRFVETHRAGFVDPGFRSTITLEIKNHFENTVVFEGQIVTLADWESVEGVAKTYEGHYQGQLSPTLPRQFKGYRKIWGEFE